jgi:hypothetical protein
MPPPPRHRPELQIGARIAAVRKRQAMTQHELAAALEMGQSLLSPTSAAPCASTARSSPSSPASSTSPRMRSWV